ncbi:ankyrin repeat-containing domain protein [Mycena latifolia]|nr:ankyrin repeat-containing domain protein [Mycena latifolia]
MADIVGLLASVLQLVDTIAKARGYLKGFHDGPKDQRELLLEIMSLATLLKHVGEHIKRDSSGGGLQHFQEPLIHLEALMARLAKKLDPATGSVSRVSSRLTWPMWGKEDVREGFNTIERFKSLLNAWLGVDIWSPDIESAVKNAAQEQRVDHCDIIGSLKNSARNQREFHDGGLPYLYPCTLAESELDVVAAVTDIAEEQRVDHKYIFQSVRDVALKQERHHDFARRSEIIEWFSPLNFFPRQADVTSTRQPGTGLWLLESDVFKRWELETEKALWCRGMLGYSEDTICVQLVPERLCLFQWLLMRFEPNRGVKTSMSYLDHKETKMHSLPNLLASVWRQLIVHKSISPEMHHSYDTHREKHTRPSLQEISAILDSAVSKDFPVFIVVDALDEYPQGQRDSLLLHLSGLGPTVHLMFTSRPHIKIDPRLDLEVVKLEIRAADDDIRRYLKGQISLSSHLSNHIKNCPGLRDEIETSILQRSAGMFLLAKLHIDSLLTKHTVKAVREALANMPGDLNSTYDEVMERINQQNTEDRHLARRTLSWISNVKRLLHMFELQEALAVEEGTPQLDPDNLLAVDTILSVCAGLVVVNEEDGLVRLIHYTTQDYLDRIHTREFPLASAEITVTCITYLSFVGLAANLHDPTKLFHFLDYAVEYCLIHARGSPEISVRDKILTFLESCSVWQKLWNQTHPFQSLPDSPTPLWIAAIFHLEELCRSIIKADGVGSTLQEAAMQGLYDVVRILLEIGVDVETGEGEYDNALQGASTYGHEDIIRLLIKNGADVNSQGRHYGTALQSAAFFGQTQSARLLLEAGANVDADGGFYGTALHAATSRGYYKIVYMLIEHGVNVDAEDKWDGTALQIASLAGHKDLVMLLIKNGANINSCGGWRGSPLQLASSAGHEAIVKFLIENGADINANAGKCGTPLCAAASQGRYTIVRLLIQHGAELNIRGPDGTALCSALTHKRLDIARLLIENGVNVDECDGDCGTILQRASFLGKEAVERLLREHGSADVSTQVGASGTALNSARQTNHGGIVTK